MKAKIVNSSMLKDAECWSAKRFLDSCHECKIVESCSKNRGMPESKKGFIRLMRQRKKALKEEYLNQIASCESKESRALEGLKATNPDMVNDI